VTSSIDTSIQSISECSPKASLKEGMFNNEDSTISEIYCNPNTPPSPISENKELIEGESIGEQLEEEIILMGRRVYEEEDEDEDEMKERRVSVKENPENGTYK
jgi:hypothetical protein